MAQNKHLIDVSCFEFSIPPVKTSGIGTSCGIRILQAKLSVLRSKLLTHKQLPCWPRHSASLFPGAALGNVNPRVARTWSRLSEELLLSGHWDWLWVAGFGRLSFQSQVTPTPTAFTTLQSQHNYFWATWAKT